VKPADRLDISDQYITYTRDMKGPKLNFFTDAVLLIPILVHAAVRVQFPREHKYRNFAATGRRPGFGTLDPVEVAVEDTWVGGRGAQENQGISVGDKVGFDDCLKQSKLERSSSEGRVVYL
jgi:hypothetical protein